MSLEGISVRARLQTILTEFLKIRLEHAVRQPKRWELCWGFSVKRLMTFADLETQVHVLSESSIVRFNSRDQQPCFSMETKENVCIITELNSRRIWSGLQLGRRFFV